MATCFPPGNGPNKFRPFSYTGIFMIYISLPKLYFLYFSLIFYLHHCHTYTATCFLNTLHLNLPVRYLFMQILDEDGANVTKSIGDIKVEVKTLPQYDCRYRSEIVDRFDGVYILRIKLWSGCEELNIQIKGPEGYLLCGSPIVIENPLHLIPEHCNCPIISLDEWMKNYNCSDSLDDYPQLSLDLSQWKTIDFEKVIQKVEENWGHERNRFATALCHYKIVDNEIYRKCYGEYTGFKMFVDSVMTSLARKMVLPDMEFIHNLGDWPLQKKIEENGVPIVSWCGSKSTMDIVLPTYELMESVLKSMETITLDLHTASGKTHVPWEEKLNKAVFRGRDSNELRLKIAKLAISRPDLINGGITRYFFFDKEKNPATVEHLSFHDFFKHRYVLSVDGTVSAYRFAFLLAGDSVILKSESDYYEHFYTQLKENFHFLPFNGNNLVEVLEKVKTEDFRHIIKNAQQFVQENLQPLNLYCYHAKFLKEYAKKLINTSKNVTNMEKVEKFDSSRQGNCNCPSDKNSRVHAEL